MLATLSYDPSPDFAVQRQYLWGWSLGWWDNTALITPGNPSVYQEVPFGGYRMHVKFVDWFFQWDDRSIMLQDLFEDLYATAPGSAVPISAGLVGIQYKVVENWRNPIINIIVASPDNYYWFQRLPEADRPYWRQMMDVAPATPFPFDGTP